MTQHRKAIEVLQDKEICSQGCGEIAKFLSPGDKFICKSTSSQCPVNKEKAAKGLKKAHAGAGGSYFKYDSLDEATKQRMNHNKGKTAATYESIVKRIETYKANIANGVWIPGHYGVAVNPALRWKRNKFNYVDSFSNECVLESWNELIVANELDRNGIKWLRPGKFILSSGKFYEPDFYLSDYNVYLDPKSKFFGKRVYQGYSPYVDQTEKIKMFEIEYKIPCLILWSHEKNSFCWESIKRRVAERYTQWT